MAVISHPLRNAVLAVLSWTFTVTITMTKCDAQPGPVGSILGNETGFINRSQILHDQFPMLQPYLDDNHYDVVLFEGDINNEYIPVCIYSLNTWIFCGDGSDHCRIMLKDEQDPEIRWNHGRAESFIRLSALHINQSGSYTCCTVDENMKYHCLRELHIQYIQTAPVISRTSVVSIVGSNTSEIVHHTLENSAVSRGGAIFMWVGCVAVVMCLVIGLDRIFINL